MKKVLISFGNKEYYKSLDLLEKTALEIGKVDQFIRYTQEWLKSEPFWNKNSFILSRPRGAGYWLWKPYLILKTFEDLSEGDTVLYSDAGLKVIDDLSPLFKIMERKPNGGMIFFKLPAVGVDAHKAKTWTKRDCFILTECDEEKYWHADMGNGAISLWEKNAETITFLQEWQRFLKDPRIVTDAPNMCGQPNFIDFKDHRHDQSVLTILTTKYRFELFRDPTQYGNKEIDKFTYGETYYPQLFHHHRNFRH